MQTKYIKIILSVVLIFGLGFVLYGRDEKDVPAENNAMNAELKEKLTPEQYAVLREGGTERPYTSELLYEKRKGTYVTADCGEPVFRSEQKFDSGTGWPSFYAPINATAVQELKDSTLGIERTEIVETKCASHLGHVFNDAPQTPTGLRYCINGLALKFIPDRIE